MSYTAKSLEEIAELFESRAQKLEQEVSLSPATRSAIAVWLQAAVILRCTTLTEPCHMEKS